MEKKLLYVEPDFIIRNYAEFNLNNISINFAIEGSS